MTKKEVLMRSRSLLFYSLIAGPSRRLGKRSLLPILSILILLCPGLAGTASAGVNAWTTNGPEGGGLIAALAIDPSAPATLYAGDGYGRGVFKSSDGGVSWKATGLTNAYVYGLAIDPSAPATLYAGTYGGGVFKTSNGGESWTAVNTGLTNPWMGPLSLDPSAPATLYAASFENGGVFKSTNGGGNWTAVNTGLTYRSLSALAIDPSTTATLYAGGAGVFKSTNGGGGWTAINAGLTSRSVFALVIDPTNPATLYAGTESGGVFKSTNGGGSWATINAGLTNTKVLALAIDPSNPATLYAGTEGGVFKSSDGGGSWTAMNQGLTSPVVYALAISPSAPAALYAGTEGGGVFDYRTVGLCTPGPTTLCLNDGRFQVQAEWTARDGSSGPGQARAMTGDAGYFTFFDPANVEVMVKVLNGCGLNGNFWIFAAGLTDVNVVMTVTDRQTGAVKIYTNAQGTPFPPIQDTGTFATCP
jgi:photosystem II stability/assembly factor-like uncharacterized protein